MNSKLAVVIGAAGGLGAGFARRLAHDGYRLFLMDRRTELFEQVCNQIAREFGVTAQPCVADLRDREQVANLAQRSGQISRLP